ncbi:MAG: hypothetical protein Q9181_007498 [Wetmoreana brouardii]
MAPQKRKRSQGQPSKNVAVTQDSDDASTTGPALFRPVTDTPFAIEMHKQMDTQPYADPTQPPTMTPMVTIRPESVWATLKKYRNFVLRDQTYYVHQYVLISRFQPLPKEHKPLDTDDEVLCVARILEIRARDSQNVYVRVYWLYRPEEIPSGRQPYHGEHELVATNHMEIVDTLRVIRPARVNHLEDEKLWFRIPKVGLYWRQRYNFILQELSRMIPTLNTVTHLMQNQQVPRNHCICSRPVKPEGTVICCNNPQCGLLLHGNCIANAALEQVILDQQARKDSQPDLLLGIQQQTSKKHKLAAKKTTPENRFTVELVVSQRPQHQGRRRLLYKDLLEERSWETDIECLRCRKRIR